MLRDEYMRRYGNSSSLDEDDPESPTNAGSIAESPASPTYDAPPYLQLSPNDFVIASDELLAEDIHVLPPSSVDAEGRVKITRRGRQVSFSPAEPITTVDLDVAEEAEPRIPSKVPEAMKPINVTGRGRVLVSAGTNVAIDELLQRLLDMPGFKYEKRIITERLTRDARNPRGILGAGSNPNEIVYEDSDGTRYVWEEPLYKILRIGRPDKMDSRVHKATMEWHLSRDITYRKQVENVCPDFFAKKDTLRKAIILREYLNTFVEAVYAEELEAGGGRLRTRERRLAEPKGKFFCHAPYFTALAADIKIELEGYEDLTFDNAVKRQDNIMKMVCELS